jgi:hypothetical protein
MANATYTKTIQYSTRIGIAAGAARPPRKCTSLPRAFNLLGCPLRKAIEKRSRVLLGLRKGRYVHNAIAKGGV